MSALDYQIVCERCGGIDVEYIGEAYDDEQYLGSAWNCLECGHRFNQFENEDWFDDDDDISGNPDLTEVSGGYD